MTPEAAVRQRIIDLTTSAASRVYMLKLPQQPTLPAVRVQRVVGIRGQHLRGPDGSYRTRVQVDTFATTHAAASDLADEILGDGLGPNASGLWGWVGELGSPAIRIKNIEVDPEGSTQFEADELNQARLRTDYIVHWN